MWPFNRNAKRLALAEAEMLKAISILAAQHEQVESAVNELVEAMNRFGLIMGLEWNQNDKKWLKLQ